MKFDTIVKERANQRAQARLDAFQKAVIAAARTLTGANGGYPSQMFDDGDANKSRNAIKLFNRSLLEAMLTKPGERRWPARFWREEEELVTKELLSTMDEMQRALIAAKAPRDADEAQPDAGETK